MKAVKVLNSALNCGIKVKKEGEEEEEEEECDIVLACCEIVANDVRDLFTLFHSMPEQYHIPLPLPLPLL